MLLDVLQILIDEHFFLTFVMLHKFGLTPRLLHFAPFYFEFLDFIRFMGHSGELFRYLRRVLTQVAVVRGVRRRRQLVEVARVEDQGWRLWDQIALSKLLTVQRVARALEDLGVQRSLLLGCHDTTLFGLALVLVGVV